MTISAMPVLAKVSTNFSYDFTNTIVAWMTSAYNVHNALNWAPGKYAINGSSSNISQAFIAI